MEMRTLAARVGRERTIIVVSAIVTVMLAAGGFTVLAKPGVTGAKALEASKSQPFEFIPNNPRPHDLIATDDQQAMAMAIATGSSVEVLSEREPAAEVFAQPDGTWRRNEWLAPVWVQVGGDGTSEEDWSPVTLDLQQDSSGVLTPAAYPGALEIYTDLVASDVLVSWAIPGSEVVLELLAPMELMPEPVIEGARARYVDVLPGVDLVVDVMPTGYEKFFVIHTQDALKAHADDLALEYRVLEGSVEQVDSGLNILDITGTVVGFMPDPFGWDASQDPYIGTPVLAPWAVQGANPAAVVNDEVAQTVAIDWDVAVAGDRVDVTLRAPALWLEEDFDSFPVIIDPAASGQNFGSDMHIRSNYPNNNYSTGVEFIIGKDPSYAHVYRSLLGISTTHMKTLDVISARMYLWNYWSATCSAVPWRAYMSGTPSTGHTWNNQPSYYSPIQYSWETAGHTSGSTPHCSQGWASIDISAFMSTWKSSTSSTQGIMIMADNEGATAQWKRFYSLESSNPNKPHISFTYNRHPYTPANLTYTAPNSTTRGKLSVTVTDPDGTWSQVRGLFTAERRPVGSTGAWEMMFDQSEGTLVASGGTSVRELELIGGFEYRFTAWGHDTRIKSGSATAPLIITVPSDSGFIDIPPVSDTQVGALSLVRVSAAGGRNDA